MDKTKARMGRASSDLFNSSNDERDEEQEFDLEMGSPGGLVVGAAEIPAVPLENSSFEILDDEKSSTEDDPQASSGEMSFSKKLFKLGNGQSSFPLLNSVSLIKSPIRIDKSTANLSLVMESAPGQILNSIGVSQISLNNQGILDSLLNAGRPKSGFSTDIYDDERNHDPEFIVGREDARTCINNQDTLKTVEGLSHPFSETYNSNISFPLSPCSSDGIDVLPRLENAKTSLRNNCFQSLDGYFVFKEGRMFQNGVRLRFCDYCRMYQPLRTKHCSSCERCIRTHDHHCPWLGVCIGEYNRCKFWWLSLVQFPECIWILYCIFLCLFKVDFSGNRPSIFDICSLISIAGNALFIAFLSLLLVVYHLFLAYNNLTTWENLAWNKISYLKSFPDSQESPFSKGHLYNMAVFCIPYYVDDLIIGDEGEIIWERSHPKSNPRNAIR
ncbi:DHHC zinc finger domain-containing protein [Cryptosporidium felis]|nr:DHHC zinc finger domain-containing protein [Cryptosporidium felis]